MPIVYSQWVEVLTAASIADGDVDHVIDEFEHMCDDLREAAECVAGFVMEHGHAESYSDAVWYADDGEQDLDTGDWSYARCAVYGLDATQERQFKALVLALIGLTRRDAKLRYALN